MIDHIGISVSDFSAAKAFYDKALGPIGMTMLAKVPVEFTGGLDVAGYGRERPQFWITGRAAQMPGLHVAFTVASRAEVRLSAGCSRPSIRA